MFATLLLSTMFAVAPAPPDPKEPWDLTADEKDALEALKKIDFGLVEKDGFPAGTCVEFLHHANAPKATEADLKPLARLTRLRCVVLPGFSASEAILDAICAMPNLERLDLSHSPLTDDGAKKLASLTMLRSLNISRTQITDEGMKSLAQLPNLSVLDVRGTKVADAGLTAFARHPSLRWLYISNTGVTDAGLKALEGNERLTDLSVGWEFDPFRRGRHTFADRGKSDITDAGLESLSKMPSLESLGLSSNQVTDKGLALLAKPGAFPNLRLVGLESSQVTDKGLEQLAKPEVLPQLNSFGVAGKQLTDKGLALLTVRGVFPKLKTLGFRDTAVTEDGLKVLYDTEVFPNLQYLCLPSSGVSDQAVHELRQARPGLKSVDR